METNQGNRITPTGENGDRVRVEKTSSQRLEIGLLTSSSFHEPWFISLKNQIVELLSKQPPLPKYRGAPIRRSDEEVHIALLNLGTLHEPWFVSLKRQFKDFKKYKSLPPLEIASQPVNVKSIWGAYNYKQQGVGTSVGVHVLIVVLIFFTSSAVPLLTSKGQSIDLVLDFDISPYVVDLMKAPPGKKSGGGGGGGQNTPLPASRGRLPRFSMQQLAPPTPVIKNINPKLSVEPTVIVQDYAQAPQIDMQIFGDPFGGIGPPAAGVGIGGGIGTGRGTGVGSGRGAGVGPGSGGGIGGGLFRIGGGVSAPRLTYKVEPEYSEEARKAKYQGTVVLAIEVWPDGKAHNIRVIRSLGLGLDQKAVDAVQQWRFVPGKKDKVPVKVRANVEVNFRLL
jgi:protein TonB